MRLKYFYLFSEFGASGAGLKGQTIRKLAELSPNNEAIKSIVNQFDQLSNEAMIPILPLFTGNKSEKEIEIIKDMNPSPSYTPEANMAIIKTKMKFIQLSMEAKQAYNDYTVMAGGNDYSWPEYAERSGLNARLDQLREEALSIRKTLNSPYASAMEY